jgi:hypothetical protein
MGTGLPPKNNNIQQRQGTVKQPALKSALKSTIN